jgi:hypothetical protein
VFEILYKLDGRTTAAVMVDQNTQLALDSKITRFVSTPCSTYKTSASSAYVLPVGTMSSPDENHSVLQK